MRIVSLEAAFRKSCRRHPHLKLLESQWRFDKELISKALQNISSIFPHYSRHDASHSKQIIVNIERLLGDKIEYLSATDMWLILEAAYNHDIGMIVTHKQIQDMESPAFAEFVRDIAMQTEDPLHDFAEKWIAEQAIVPSGAAAHAFFNEYIQLIAEWYRRKHPENSANIINDPFYEIGLDSPRNELLPKRLFGTLASICKAHGQSFEEMMALPFAEAGMATEDCHPRYVAALLRMGDLLDIDDNRFCPVMMRMSGEKLPSTSHAHLDKHKSIRHFRLNSERIEIEAVCPTPESYVVAYEWFEWLEREYHKQSQRWHKIVPSKKLGRLPTLSPPDVSLVKPYVVLEKGKKPGFNVDQDEILKLLRSTGLYSSKFESVREILQNAVDSTLLSIWVENRELIKETNPLSDILSEIYDRKKIDVQFSIHGIDERLLTMTVKDRGAGISKNDLKTILKVGGSTKNKAKQSLVENMPQWFKPSGNFGIGLQSIYLLSDSFSITTKSIFSHEAMRISFSKTNENPVIIEDLPSDSIDYGAIIKVDIVVAPFPSRMSVPFGTEGEQLLRKLNVYDFTDEETDLSGYEEINLFRAVHDFSKGSPIKIIASDETLSKEGSRAYFSKKHNTILSSVEFFDFGSGRFRTLFRGQEFSDLHPSIPMVACCIDYYGYQASDFISYNREKILKEAKEKAAEDLVGSLLEYVDKYFLEFSPEDKIFAAVFYILNQSSEVERDKYKSYVLSHFIKFEKHQPIKLSNVLELVENGTINKVIMNLSHKEIGNVYGDGTYVLHGGAQEANLKLILRFSNEAGLYLQESSQKDSVTPLISFFKDDVCPLCHQYFKDVLTGNGNVFWEIGNRVLFPVWGEFRKLEIEKSIPWARIIRTKSQNAGYMVLPGKFGVRGDPLEFDLSDRFVSWVHDNLKDKSVSRADIKALYIKLVSYMEEILA
ncbi:ATP-binding protein [Pseudomonas sp. B21-021]|uniref:HD domain-containing protein n=1 Tax=Pseudomonas sp. B21-021 TaxID=2895476 RepID=UPI00215F8E18|nr:ATP-binding protein [Pseudomonas sp. B21-021]UVM27460.1 ATP-binding protein [Pseudomonas sp. B21-021]